MLLQLVVARAVFPVEATPGGVTLGGGPADVHPVAGLPPAVLRVSVESSRVVVVPDGPAWMTGVRLRRGEAVLLFPGAAVSLTRRGRVRLVHPDDASPPEPLDTRSLLRQLLVRGEIPTGIGVPRLLCIAGVDRGRSLLLPGGPLALGRAPGCALRLRDAAVSRWQARLWMEGEAVWLSDLGTPGGTRVNGRRVHTARRLVRGDLIGVGRTLLRYTSPPLHRGNDAAPGAEMSVRALQGGTAPRRWPPLAVLGVASALAGATALAALRFARPPELRSAAAPGRPVPPKAPPAAGGARRSW